MGVQGAQSSQWDQLFEEVDSGRVFGGGGSLVAAGANMPRVQLFNPDASPKLLVVVGLFWQGSGTGLAGVVRTPTAHTTLLAGNAAFNTFFVASQAEIRGQSDTTVIAPSFGDLFSSTAMASRNYFARAWPHVPAGEGLTVAGRVAAGTLTASFFWVEIDA